MGEDKARLELAGSSFMEHALATLRDLDAPLVLATGPQNRYADFGLTCVQDAPDTAGPAAGLLAAMDAVQADRYLLVACDMPRLDARILDALLARSESKDLDACFFENERGREPLCAIYSRRILPALRAAQTSRRRRVMAFMDEPVGKDLRIGVLNVTELDAELRDVDCARNVNTPEEFREERRVWEGDRA